MMNAAILGLKWEELREALPRLEMHGGDEVQEDGVRAYATDPAGEYEMIFDIEGRVESVFIYRQSELLRGLACSFEDTPEMIQARFGNPARSGVQKEAKFIGRQGAWVRYDLEAYSIHFQRMWDSERLKMITVMRADVARKL